ncbi:MAG: hypothetical protein A3F17_00415 [Gammaproteobacteria bacterium RIFCSPHIGHO2_12_FULL_41_15]|nr:MAG: hypothetical protein A3F17_00415 [Gammaproteobacteria bacterium RIFCSPHIGHO2_12_FULL_41_15]
MGNFSTIDLSQNGPITTLSLNRPDVHNAFNALMIHELSQALISIKKNGALRTLILTAKGQHFCAGADLRWMQEMANFDFEKNNADALTLANLLQQLAELSIPTIALVQGRVMGGGCGLAACCDFVIASEDTRFCFSEVKLGLIPATIAPYVLRRIGFNATRRYFLTAELIESDTAQQIHLIDEIVSHDILHSSGIKLADLLCQNGPQALVEVKKLLKNLAPIDPITLKSTAHHLATIRCSAEAKEGISAFLEKRPPKWILKKGQPQ